MLFQRVLKGITGLTQRQAAKIACSTGIKCSWLRNHGPRSIAKIEARLTDAELYQHLVLYDDPDPAFANERYGDHTPFISTTAGTVEVTSTRTSAIYTPFPAVASALAFATKNFTQPGYIFYAYLVILGRGSLPLVEFAEEIRDSHIYRKQYQFHHEGEITAKILIPPSRIQRAERYDPPSVTPSDVVLNPRYQPPELYTNIRDAL